MLKKAFIPIICILFLQTKLSSCFLPLFFDIENEALKFVPVSETVIVNSLFLTDRVDTQDSQYQDQENDDYFDKIQKLEDNLNKEQNNFIHQYILNDQQSQSESINNVQQKVSNQNEHSDSSYIYIELNRNIKKRQAEDLLIYISQFTLIPIGSFKELSVRDNLVVFLLDAKNVSASNLVNKILKYQLKISKEQGFEILSCGLVTNGDKVKFSELKQAEQTKEILIIFGIIFIIALCTLLIIVVIAYTLKKRFTMSQDFYQKKSFDEEECLINESKKEDSKWLAYVPFVKSKKTQDQSPVHDYQDLCRQRMTSKVSPINTAITPMPDAQTPALPSPANCQVVNTNTINSTPIRITDTKGDQRNSSWLEESMCHFNIDITTGHVILSYIEKYLNDKDLMNKDWKYLSEYEADQNSTQVAGQRKNYNKNRYENLLPYDFSLVKLRNAEENDYINASYIIDDDPKNPAYIAAQSPLKETASEFWQMIWENQTVVIVNLSNDKDTDKCFQYWPDKGFKIYNKYEIHFASEHAWNDDFLVRNFFFKHIETDQTRTVTQFQYLSWDENDVPSVKSFLDFRRKVNKCYSSKTCPIVVHCNDGIGRTGTYILVDMVLNKVAKGAKEIDLAATLEFLRDQRQQMIRQKVQYEFSFKIIIHEVKNYLNYLGN